MSDVVFGRMSSLSPFVEVGNILRFASLTGIESHKPGGKRMALQEFEPVSTMKT